MYCICFLGLFWSQENTYNGHYDDLKRMKTKHIATLTIFHWTTIVTYRRTQGYCTPYLTALAYTGAYLFYKVELSFIRLDATSTIIDSKPW